MCGSPVCTFFPMRVCLCVQTCALISFYWHCCVTCWILMWDDLFLPLSSRCSQRYPTCFKNTPCDELEDQREATDYYLAVVHKGNLSHVFIYISFSLWTEAYEREKKKHGLGLLFSWTVEHTEKHPHNGSANIILKMQRLIWLLAAKWKQQGGNWTYYAGNVGNNCGCTV